MSSDYLSILQTIDCLNLSYVLLNYTKSLDDINISKEQVLTPL